MQQLLKDKRENALLQLSREKLRSEHLAFLSHFKVEAGTEAALMRAELEAEIRSDKSRNLGESFDAPVFLDSEDLDDLQDR